jgi:hypothetical protein
LNSTSLFDRGARENKETFFTARARSIAFSAAATAFALLCALTRDNFLGDRRAPFPQVAADALHKRVFDLSMFSSWR